MTKRSEVVAFLGRNSKILNDSEEPVHIIMERVTSKTNDAYVEFNTLDDAMKAVAKHHDTMIKGRLSRLGDRPVEVELSSQAALMRDLFPVARGLRWNGAHPEILPINPMEPWEQFRGFISEEEMTMLVKHVEVPHRVSATKSFSSDSQASPDTASKQSPFSKECPQRPFECLISTLKKFPWHMTEFITLRQRHAMFKATMELIRLLGYHVKDKKDQVNLTSQLLRRLISAGMTCPGFTIQQKDCIASSVNMPEIEMRGYSMPRYSWSWTHQYALGCKPGVPLDVIEVSLP
jgi:hypothetical protein